MLPPVVCLQSLVHLLLVAIMWRRDSEDARGDMKQKEVMKDVRIANNVRMCAEYHCKQLFQYCDYRGNLGRVDACGVIIILKKLCYATTSHQACAASWRDEDHIRVKSSGRGLISFLGAIICSHLASLRRRLVARWCMVSKSPELLQGITTSPAGTSMIPNWIAEYVHEGVLHDVLHKVFHGESIQRARHYHLIYHFNTTSLISITPHFTHAIIHLHLSPLPLFSHSKWNWDNSQIYWNMLKSMSISKIQKLVII